MRTKLLLIAFLLVLGVASAQADTIAGSAGFSLQSWTLADLNLNGTPYWDNPSNDFSTLNIGYFLTKTGGFAGYPPYFHPSVIPQYWGSASGAADPNFKFTGGGSADSMTLQIAIANLAPTNVFGWYDTSLATFVPHPIFTGNAVTAATFSPTASYGFYLTSTFGTFLTESGRYSTTDTGSQHFAPFYDSTTGLFWIGGEDERFLTADKDYNDIIVTFSPVPEPMSVLLVGSGLVVLGLIGSRRKR